MFTMFQYKNLTNKIVLAFGLMDSNDWCVGRCYASDTNVLTDVRRHGRKLPDKRIDILHQGRDFTTAMEYYMKYDEIDDGTEHSLSGD